VAPNSNDNLPTATTTSQQQRQPPSQPKTTHIDRMATFEGLPNEMTLACLKFLDQDSIASVARVSRHLYAITPEILYRSPSVGANSVSALCLTLARRPELGKHIRHLVFTEHAVDRHSRATTLPWKQTDLVVQGLQRLLGSKPPEKVAAQWRFALFHTEALGGQQTFIVCSAPKLESIVSRESCFFHDCSLWTLLNLKLRADTVPSLPHLASMDVQAGSELLFLLPPELRRLVLKQAENDATFDLTMLPSGWSSPIHTIELLQCKAGAEMLRSLLAAHSMPHLTRLVVLDFAWNRDADYKGLVADLAAQCEQLETLVLDFGYQVSEDDSATTPLPPSCWANLSKLRTLTLHRDLLYNRDERPVLLRPPPDLPPRLTTFKLSGLHGHDLRRQSLPRKHDFRTMRDRAPSLQSLTFSTDLDVMRGSPRPPHLHNLRHTLPSTVARASCCKVMLKVLVRYTGDADLQELSLV
jgi:hypothetical protein